MDHVRADLRVFAGAWDRTKDTTNIALLEAFITHYKETFFAELARARIDELKKQQVAIAPPPPPPAQPSAKCEGIETQVESERRCLKPKDSFKDCADCPELVVVPAGRFTMGSPANEPESEPYVEGSEDQLAVTIAKRFAVGRYAVTRGEFAAFVEATGHKTEGGCYTWNGSEWKQQADRNCDRRQTDALAL